MEAPVRRHGHRHRGRDVVNPPRIARPWLALAAALALAVLAVPVDGGSVARAVGPLPACRYDDILTSPRGYGDWSKTLVDTILMVPRAYVPPDLVPVADAGITGPGKLIRAVAIDDLREMAEAALAAGNAIGVQSSYRSYAEQEAVFQGWVDQLGYRRALEVSARPGHSEHQLGVAIDFKADPGPPPFNTHFEDTPAGKWMAIHAWEYGWLLSYPVGKTAVTCYDDEAWHYRYVGRDLAAKVHASRLTVREYLWAHFTTTVVPPPSPRPPASAAATAVATAAPSIAPTASPSAAPATPSPTPSAVATALPTGTPVASVGPTPAPSADPVAGPGLGSDTAMAAIALGALVGVLVAGGLVARRRGRFGAVL